MIFCPKSLSLPGFSPLAAERPSKESGAPSRLETSPTLRRAMSGRCDSVPARVRVIGGHNMLALALGSE
jgi:hypothetical protein